MVISAFPIGHSRQKRARSIQRPEASSFNANSRNGRFLRVRGNFSMHDAMSRFSSKFSALPNTISLAAMREKFPLYHSDHQVPGVKSQPGESEMATFLPRKSDRKSTRLNSSH